MPKLDSVKLDAVKDEMIRSDAHFRTLWEEHQETKRKLDEMQSRGPHAAGSQHEIKRIKLHKLTLKDQMEAMMYARLHRRTASL